MAKKDYTDEEKFNYIEEHMDNLGALSDEELMMFADFVDYGVERDWPCALMALGYGCYGGNEIYETDWETSKRCMLKLIELTDDPFCYNTLGYIYYYGRCNNGVPEYDKAFQYFAVGAAHGIYESRYKLADMFLTGKGALKSPSAAANMVMAMYNDNKEIFCEESYESKFADIALRVGGFFERGDGVEQNDVAAYAYYKEAKLAIDKRVELFDFFGDRKVQKNIKASMDRVLKKLGNNFFQDKFTIDNPIFFAMLLKNSVGIDLDLHEDKDGRFVIRAKSVADDELSGKTIINIATIDYCELIDEAAFYLSDDVEFVENFVPPMKAFITGINYDEEADIWNFLYRDRIMISIKCSEFEFIPLKPSVKDNFEDTL